MITTFYIWLMWFCLLVAYALFLYRKYSSLKGESIQITEYEPPEKINPMMCGFLVDRKLNIRDILSGILFLHQKGIIDFKKSDPGISFLSNKRILSGQRQIEDIAYKKKYIHYPFSFLNIFLYGLVIALFAGMGLYLFIYQVKIGIIHFSQLEVYIYFLSFPLLVWVAVLISRLTRPQYTKKGKEIRNKINGFHRYIEVAEKDRIKFENSLRENSELFTYYLSYAIALGVHYEWLTEYTFLLRPIPDWYQPATLIIMPSVYLNGRKIYLEELINLVEYHS